MFFETNPGAKYLIFLEYTRGIGKESISFLAYEFLLSKKTHKLKNLQNHLIQQLYQTGRKLRYDEPNAWWMEKYQRAANKS